MNYHEEFKFFYNSPEWKQLRASVFVEENGLCQLCKKKGVASIGEEVHHIIPIKQDWSKRLDRNNLILLCKNCHNGKHGRESPLQKFNKFWEELNGK